MFDGTSVDATETSLAKESFTGKMTPELLAERAGAYPLGHVRPADWHGFPFIVPIRLRCAWKGSKSNSLGLLKHGRTEGILALGYILLVGCV